MIRIFGRSIALAALAKCMAIGAFFLFLTAFPIDKRFSLYDKQEFLGKPSTRLDPWIVNWANFDGFNYLLIARRGYGPERVAFFPLYPLSIRALLPTDSFPSVVSGHAVSFLALAGSLFLLYLLLQLDTRDSRLIPIFFATVLLFPTAYSYSAIYNDSLFLFFASATLYLSRTKHVVWASLCAALATLARLNGLALLPFLFVDYFSPEQTHGSWSIVSYKQRIQKHFWNRTTLWSMISMTLIPLAFLGYLLYLQHTFGDWHILFTSMKTWGQDRMIFPLQTMVRYARIFILVTPRSVTYWVAVLEVGFFLWYCTMLWWSWGKIRFSYWVFFFFSILIPALTGTFQGMPRYGLHLYPLFLATTMWLMSQPRSIKLLYFSLSAALYLTCVTLFTHGFFIA